MNRPWPSASLGIQARLVILTFVTVLPLVALSAIAIVRNVGGERAQIEHNVRERVGILLATVDREIRGLQFSLQGLASSPLLEEGKFEEFGEQIREALKIQGLAIGLHNTAADELVSTTRPFGELPLRQTNRQMVDRVVRTGEPHVSDLFMGSVLRRPIVAVGVPVLRDGKPIYVLTLAIDPARLSAVLQDQSLPPDWTASILDRKGVVIARNRDLDRFFGQPATLQLR
jgi:hypothetical protein